jgi:hypothetical protein
MNHTIITAELLAIIVLAQVLLALILAVALAAVIRCWQDERLECERVRRDRDEWMATAEDHELRALEAEVQLDEYKEAAPWLNDDGEGWKKTT